MTLRIRHLALVNPGTSAFDALAPTAELTFMPLETVWSDQRLDTSRIAAKADVSTGYVRFQNGDVIVPKTAPTFQHARAAVVSGLKNGIGAGSSELHLLRPRPGTEARFLAYVTRSADFIAKGVSAYQGVAGLQRVSTDFLANWPVTPISWKQQLRIADFLDDQVARLDRGIQGKKAQAALLEDRRQATVQQMLDKFTGGETRLKYLCVSPGKYGLNVPAGEYVHGSAGLRMLRTSDIASADSWRDVDGIYVPRQLVDPESHLRIGDILVSRAGTIGRAFIAPRDVAGMTFAGFLIRFRSKTGVDPRFIIVALESTRIQAQIREGATTSTIDNFNAERYGNLKLPVILAEDQQRLVRSASHSLDQYRLASDRLQCSINLLHERKQALITAAVTGQFDVTTARAVA